jgi:hypothetical protein
MGTNWLFGAYMIKCICGKSLKSKIGLTQHGKNCQKFIADKLAGGSGEPPLPDNVDVARDQLKGNILSKSIETLQDCLNGVPMKECRIRAAIAVIKLTGADKPKLIKHDKVVVNFGEDPESLFEPDEEDEDKSDESTNVTIAV